MSFLYQGALLESACPYFDDQSVMGQVSKLNEMRAKRNARALKHVSQFKERYKKGVRSPEKLHTMEYRYKATSFTLNDIVDIAARRMGVRLN